ncbi:plastocyanin/azurin family copper-binding protein [Halobacteria archaeon AArc-m2/3/4]|uniref:Plastocyanin/azurin family copper-binding protein n=1 Tax=Natronoglomus mannanivorans TaxID=2979990 RepID=A0ABT2QB18_9EURY|nr:plastocyanin/azurin family copper-binding protein [Halobacteria archaeon AArc-m2/3/4]
MTRDKRFSRRSIVKLTGASAVTALIAGCGGPETEDEADDDGTGDEAAPGEDEENGDVGADEEEAEDEDENGAAEDDEEEAEDEDENGAAEDDEGEDEEEDEENGNGNGAEDWGDVDEIVLDGYTAGWEGVEPEMIEGEENPTLELTAGTEYEITWENADGDPHNIEIWDDDDEVVDDYQTEIIDEEGETQTLEFEATEEMAAYVCEVHIGTMIGDIEVQSE